MRYHALLGPSSIVVDIPAVNLRVVEANGRVTVEGGLVRLEYAKGKMAGGTVRAGGTIGFREPPGQLNTDVTAERLNLKQPPKDWTMPPGTAGTLSGNSASRSLPHDPALEGILACGSRVSLP